MTKKIQGYTLLECVGKGSSGEVFRAIHASKQGQFAIKVIQNQLLIDNPKAQECLLNQVKVLSKIGACQYIVGFHELIKTNRYHYFVYDYCNGGNLYEKLKKVRKISQSETIKYVQAILKAYKTLNKYKVLHRDLKPENILFHNGKLKLADFGLCKGLQPEQYMTKTMLGSPIYMAPEVLKGQSYTSKADIWSLGVISFQMLYGYCPYHSNSIAALASKIQTSPLQFPEQPVVSSTTKQLLKKMLTKDYFRRIGWIQLFKQMLNYQQGDLKSIKSFYDAQQMIIREQQNNKSQGKNKNSSKKTSLCLIQYSPGSNQPPFLNNYTSLNNSINNISQPRYQSQSIQIKQKQNKVGFSSSKYMALLNRSQELKRQKVRQNNKKVSKFFMEQDKYQPSYSNTSSPIHVNYSAPLYYKDYATLQASNSTANFHSQNIYSNVPNTKVKNSNTIFNNYENKKNAPYYSIPNSQTSVPSPTNKQISLINSLKKTQSKTFSNLKSPKLKQFFCKLQRIHEQFVKIAPYCQSLLKTRNKQNINDILQFLYLLRSKLNYFKQQFSKIKNNMHQQHQDIDTMISYQIIGVEEVIRNINLFNTNGGSQAKKLPSYQQNCNGYRYRSLSIEKTCMKIQQLLI